MRIRFHMDNIWVLLNVRNLTSCATVSIPRILLHVINSEFPISDMYCMWSGFLLFGETEQGKYIYTTWPQSEVPVL